VQQHLDALGLGAHLPGDEREHLLVVVVDLVVGLDDAQRDFGRPGSRARPGSCAPFFCVAAAMLRKSTGRRTSRWRDSTWARSAMWRPRSPIPFQVVVDLEHRGHEAQVARHWLVERQQLQAFLFDLISC
jgi:hypothetical protein